MSESQQKNPKVAIIVALIGGLSVIIAACIGLGPTIFQLYFGNSENPTQIPIIFVPVTPAPSAISNPPTDTPTVILQPADETPTAISNLSTDTPAATSQPTEIPTSTVTPSIPDTPTNAPATSNAKAYYKDLEFELRGCIEILGGDISCEFVVTNFGEDREIWIHSSFSEAYDNFGNEYEGDKVELANKAGSSVNLLLVSQVSTQGKLIFENISPAAEKFSLLTIQVINEDLKFRDIPINR